MIISGKKFDFYVPDLTGLDILMGIFRFIEKKKYYSCNPVKYSKFFLNISNRYPHLFKDIHFKEDPFLPYSQEIDRAYTSAMEFKIIRRPNPEIYPCEIIASDAMLEEEVDNKFTPDQKEELKQIAKEFEIELEVSEQ